MYIVRDKKSMTTPHRGIEPRALKEVSIRAFENVQNILTPGIHWFSNENRRCYHYTNAEIVGESFEFPHL